MEEDEQQIESFLASSAAGQQEQPAAAGQQETDEQILEKKMRAGGKPTPQTVLQRRTILSDQQIEARIAASIRRDPLIDELVLREKIASYLEKNENITEGAYARIVQNLLTKQEQTANAGQNQAALEPGGALASAAQSMQNQATRLIDRASMLSTPGGIGFLVAVLIFFVWVIVPVNGKTRMQLLWLVLTGQTSLPGPGAGADFSTSGGAGQLTQDQAARNIVLLPTFDVDEW